MTEKKDTFTTGKVDTSLKEEVDQWAERKQTFQIPIAQEKLNKVKEDYVEHIQLRFNDIFNTTIGLNKSKYDKLSATCPTRRELEKYFIKKCKLKFNVEEIPDPLEESPWEEEEDENTD